MAESETYPARLHVLLASQAPVGLVIRRGPSKHVATIGWDRRNDRFRLGQWMKGRIYERRSDLSPDGKRLIYFAMNGYWESEARGAWTAISRAPHVKAEALFAKGDCWHGGGLWTGNHRYWLNDGYGHDVVRDASGAKRDTDYEPSAWFGGECPSVYYLRLMRDGWRMVETEQRDPLHTVDRFEKPLRRGWVLQKWAHRQCGSGPGKGCYWDEHALVRPASNTEIALPDWEWADVDGNRLVWACEGKLFAGKAGREGVNGERELHDFNTMTFEALTAPY